jgi:hypothetical protein
LLSQPPTAAAQSFETKKKDAVWFAVNDDRRLAAFETLIFGLASPIVEPRPSAEFRWYRRSYWRKRHKPFHGNKKPRQ